MIGSKVKIQPESCNSKYKMYMILANFMIIYNTNYVFVTF